MSIALRGVEAPLKTVFSFLCAVGRGTSSPADKISFALSLLSAPIYQKPGTFVLSLSCPVLTAFCPSPTYSYS